MANEFWNVVAGILGGFIIGMVVHSAMGHSYGKRLWEIFHKDEQPTCYGRYYNWVTGDCGKCIWNIRCIEICRISTE